MRITNKMPNVNGAGCVIVQYDYSQQECEITVRIQHSGVIRQNL
ncbi:MAG: hypothetical protein PUP92_37765 [Rhizonema sp. PD38]|nr:hypothetical protein [Rhizonema sp. PD38]